MKKGICKLCLEEKELNYEHVPPRSAGNKTTKYKTGSLLDFMTSKTPFEYKYEGKTNQGGIGFYSYCEACNNFLGNEYVRYYKNWFNVGMTLIRERESQGFIFEAHQQYPLRTLKQILSMFVAVNKHPFLENNDELLQFLNNPASTSLPTNIRVFCYLNRGPKWRYLELMASGNLKTGSIVLTSEITFPPFGYVLVLNNEDYKNDLLTEITGFQKYADNKAYSLDFKMHILETNLPIPLDYRKREVIKEEIEKNNRL